jgi:hypothetical protein
MTNKNLKSLCVDCKLQPNKLKKENIRQLLSYHKEQVKACNSSVLLTSKESEEKLFKVTESNLINQSKNIINTEFTSTNISDSINSMKITSTSQNNEIPEILTSQEADSSISNKSDLILRINYGSAAAIVKEENPAEYDHFKTHRRAHVTDNFINTMFAIFQEKWPNNNYVSSFALHSHKTFKKILSETTQVTFFPVNYDHHWGLLLYKPQEKQWEFFDSYSEQSLEKNLVYSSLLLRLQQLFQTVNIVAKIYSHQSNDWSCGFYVCIYAALLSMDLTFPLQQATFKNYFDDMRFKMIRDVISFTHQNYPSFFQFIEVAETFFKDPEKSDNSSIIVFSNPPQVKLNIQNTFQSNESIVKDIVASEVIPPQVF